MEKIIALIAISIFFGLLGGFLANIFLEYYNSENSLIKEFYLTENAVHVSPHSLRLNMDNGVDNYILVDVRSQEEYEKEHIIGAINIPE